jgi:hypothetical protein
MSDNDDSGSAAAAAAAGDEGGTSLNYALALFYLLVSVFMIILAWIIPGIVIAASVGYTILACVIFIAAVVQIAYVAQIAATYCGKCPQPATSED